MTAFLALGAVVLVIAGAEALYADMGHFGRSPIRRAWFLLVFPALTLAQLPRPGRAGPRDARRVQRWRKRLFIALSRNAADPVPYFGLPPDRTTLIVMGSQVPV